MSVWLKYSPRRGCCTAWVEFMCNSCRGQRESTFYHRLCLFSGGMGKAASLAQSRRPRPLLLGSSGRGGQVRCGVLVETSRPVGIIHIGIDEISRKKRHAYLTNVYDLHTKTLIRSGDGRAMETLCQFFDYLDPERTARLQGICCDMWQPYIDAIKERAP